MKIKFKIADFQYLLIYLMLIFNQSCLYEYLLKNTIIQTGIIVVILFIGFVKNQKSYNKYLVVSGIMLCSIALTRLVVGGIGIVLWIDTIFYVIFCVYVVTFDIKNFFNRFIKVTAFLAAISLVFFIMQVFATGLLEKVLFTKYVTKFKIREYYSGYYYIDKYITGNGLFLYSFTNIGDYALRNKGIFTEPGVCQMVYNSALFILLFMPNNINFSNKLKNRYIALYVITIISTQSTTGYIALMAMIIAYLFASETGKYKTRSTLLLVVLIVATLLIIDLSWRQDESFLYTAILKKMFDTQYNFEVQGSGMSRIDAAILSIKTIISHPLGVGVDGFEKLLSKSDAGGGAGFLKFGAMAGVIPLITCCLFYIVPIFKSNEKAVIKCLLIFVIFNTLFGQTYPFYPTLIMFPIYYMEHKSLGVQVIRSNCENE